MAIQRHWMLWAHQRPRWIRRAWKTTKIAHNRWTHMKLLHCIYRPIWVSASCCRPNASYWMKYFRKQIKRCSMVAQMLHGTNWTVGKSFDSRSMDTANWIPFKCWHVYWMPASALRPAPVAVLRVNNSLSICWSESIQQCDIYKCIINGTCDTLICSPPPQPTHHHHDFPKITIFNLVSLSHIIYLNKWKNDTQLSKHTTNIWKAKWRPTCAVVVVVTHEDDTSALGHSSLDKIKRTMIFSHSHSTLKKKKENKRYIECQIVDFLFIWRSPLARCGRHTM